jgi:hypothetical protein
MNKKSLLLLFAYVFFRSNSFAQTTIYYIGFDSLVGMTLTSGDICSAPFTIEEAHQTTLQNTWGGTWKSNNIGAAINVQVELSFTYSETLSSMPTTLNGIANNNVNPGTAVNCTAGTNLVWILDPTDYISNGTNTFLVDYTASTIIHQIDNMIPHGSGYAYLKVTVEYTPSGIGIDEFGNSIEKKLVKITDLLGRETIYEPNKPLIYFYNDGSTKKVYRIE